MARSLRFWLTAVSGRGPCLTITLERCRKFIWDPDSEKPYALKDKENDPAHFFDSMEEIMMSILLDISENLQKGKAKVVKALVQQGSVQTRS